MADWIYRTGDAGASWQAALEAGDEPLGFSDLGFTTASQGVAIRGVFDVSVDGSSQLLMTLDAGSTWGPVSFR